MSIYRVRSVWSGLRGLPGVTTLYTYQVPDAIALADLKAFWTTCTGLIPTGCRIAVQGVGEIVDEATGRATGTWSATQPAEVVGAVTGQYSAPSGAVVNWRSGQFFGGREVRGRTFIVPLAGACYGPDGTLADSNRATLETAANDLIGSSFDLTIYSRRSGSAANAVTAQVPDEAVVLRSRRD